jgi:hypothetical protein
MSRDDQVFPRFQSGSFLVVSKNSMGKKNVCEITSRVGAEEAYKHLVSKYSGNWERSYFTSYAPEYFIDFKDVEILVLEGGLVITAPRPGYFFTRNRKVTFIRYFPPGEARELISHLCESSI